MKRSVMRHLAVSSLVLTSLYLSYSCKPRAPQSLVQSEGDDLDVVGVVGAHDVLPARERAIIAANQSRDPSTEEGEVLTLTGGHPAKTRYPCTSALQDIHCYADACAAQLGGKVSDNYMPSDVDPRTMGEPIKTHWNRKEIRWEPIDGVWQYTFDGRPGGRNWPEKNANLTAPVTDSRLLRCDNVSGRSEHITCIPGHKRLEVEKNGVTWVFLFRRIEPPQPGVSSQDFHHEMRWGNIAILGYKETETGEKLADGTVEGQNAVCWFNTFNKSNMGYPKTFPVPVPGGRFGTTPAELERRAQAINFFDTPAEHQTLRVAMPGSTQEPFTNCIQCHGNGPVLDVPWVVGRGDMPRGDDAIPFFSAGFMHRSLVFFREPDNACAGSCHNYWAKNTRTCDELTSYFTQVPSVAHASLRRQGWLHVDPDDPAEPSRPASDAMPVGHTHMMPDPMPGNVRTVADWSARYQAALQRINACCRSADGACSGERQGRPPKYYGEHESPPREDYRQLIPGPDAAVDMAIDPTPVRQGDTCQMVVRWRDPADRYNAPETYYVLVSDETSPDREFCRGGAVAAHDGSNGRPFDGGWRHEYAIQVPVRCGVKAKIRLCGQHAEKAGRSVEKGVVIEL